MKILTQSQSPFTAWIALLSSLLGLPLWAAAATVTPVGVIGNSGVEGKSLLKTSIDRSGAQEGGGHIDARTPSGAWIDSRTGIWIGYRDSVNNISLDGKLVEQHPLTPSEARIDGLYFAAIDRTLYFFAHDTRPGARGSDYAIYSMKMEPGSAAEPFFRFLIDFSGIEGEKLVEKSHGNRKDIYTTTGTQRGMEDC